MHGHGCDSFTRPTVDVAPSLGYTTRGWFSLHLHAVQTLSGALPIHVDTLAFIARSVAASGTDLMPSPNVFFFMGRQRCISA
jgi:hypothetical protein